MNSPKAPIAISSRAVLRTLWFNAVVVALAAAGMGALVGSLDMSRAAAAGFVAIFVAGVTPGLLITLIVYRGLRDAERTHPERHE